MIDKLDPGFSVGDPIIRGIVNKLNEVVEEVNNLRNDHEAHLGEDHAE